MSEEKQKQRKLTDAEIAFLTEPHERRWWGQPHTVKPVIVDEVFGDGEKLICLSPTNHRPEYYVVQVDSSWNLDNFAEGELLCEHLDEIYDAIEGQFGRPYEHGDHEEDECPDEEKCYVGFPGLSEDGGCSWGEIELQASNNGVNEVFSARRLVRSR
jgi:hypothetical protein